MTGTLQASLPRSTEFAPRRSDPLEGAAERLGLALLVWAFRRRSTPRRSIDLGRAPRIAPTARPFC